MCLQVKVTSLPFHSEAAGPLNLRKPFANPQKYVWKSSGVCLKFFLGSSAANLQPLLKCQQRFHLKKAFALYSAQFSSAAFRQSRLPQQCHD